MVNNTIKCNSSNNQLKMLKKYLNLNPFPLFKVIKNISSEDCIVMAADLNGIRTQMKSPMQS